MKSIMFDAGPVINFALNELLWVFPELKKHYDGKFVITKAVKKELYDTPLRSKRFAFEALRVKDMLEENFTVLDDEEVKDLGRQLLKHANAIFHVKHRALKIVQKGEVHSVAAALLYKADAIVIDERTMRMLLEEPLALKQILSRKLHQEVVVDQEELMIFQNHVKHLNIIRSVELATVAYKLGLLDRYITHEGKVQEPLRKKLLESLMWALRLRGCSISNANISEIVRNEV